MERTQHILCTYDDYLLLPDDGKRYEIIDGELSMAPAPFTDHQGISENIEAELRNFLRKTKWGTMFHAPIDVVLSMTEIVQPDIIVISQTRKEIIAKRNIVAAPDLIVEILSPSTALRDRTTKKSLYEKYGVKEYWIVDPEQETIEVFSLEKNVYIQAGFYSKNDILASKLLQGFTATVADIFELM